MKTAISIPDSIFDAAERLCKRHRIARSRFYAMAIKRLVDEYHEEDVTTKLNQIYGQERSDADGVLSVAQAATLIRERW